MTKVDKNFVARTEKKLEKSIWIDWFPKQVRFNIALRLRGKVMCRTVATSSIPDEILST